MAIHSDVKTLPELADLTPEQRQQIEYAALVLSMRDWQGWACLFVAGALAWLVRQRILPENATAQFFCMLGGFAVGVAGWVVVLSIRACQHARRIAATLTPPPKARAPHGKQKADEELRRA
jgi:hypothetical protein